ncbi:MAG: DUF1566 domain-containing protein [Bacteroidota bacterium]|nr:DUF1566 domain-containing protein [Bacteroidota bacterium]MDP4273488.1 DUF1566 domain-containing protein [Bacteroidota bacterium]
MRKLCLFAFTLLFIFLFANNQSIKSQNHQKAENSCFKHYIGELYGGGIVVAVWEKDGIEKGLIASLSDLGNEVSWSNVKTKLKNESLMDGKSCTDEIIAQEGHTESAAKLCRDYRGGGFSDWYLPSIRELRVCFNTGYIIYQVLGEKGAFQYDKYWSSTDHTGIAALACQFAEDNPNSGMGFAGGNPALAIKSKKYRVRAVRQF